MKKEKSAPEVEEQEEQEIQEEQTFSFEDVVNSVVEAIEVKCSEVHIDPVSIDISNLDGIKYNKNDFQKGISDYSYLAGAITALKNAGLDSENIVAYLTTDKVMENNISVASINRDGEIETAKQTGNLIKNNQM